MGNNLSLFFGENFNLRSCLIFEYLLNFLIKLIAMKSFIITWLLAGSAFGVSAQNCNGFYFFTNNAEVVMTVYDKKGAEGGKLTYKISGVNKSGNNATADFTSEFVDDKGKSLSKGAGKLKCNAGVLYVDAKVSVPQTSMAAYKDMDVKGEESFVEYPSSMSVGQTLKDVNFSMEVHNKGSLFSTITLTQENRKVIGKENISSPAGTWECWKISYDAQFKATMMGIGIPINMKATEWFAPGFGLVKSESFSKNGKLLGSTLITSVNK